MLTRNFENEQIKYNITYIHNIDRSRQVLLNIIQNNYFIEVHSFR